MERMGQRALGARRGTGDASPSSRALPHRRRVAPVLALAVAAACAASRRYRDETRTMVETDLVFNTVSEDRAGVSSGGATTGRLPSARENAEWDAPPSDAKDDYSYDGYDGYDYDGYDYDGDEQGHGTPETALERTSYPKMNRTSYSEMNKVCRTIPKEGRPLYTQEEWQRFRRIYRDTGGITIDVDAPVPDNFEPPLTSGHTNDGKVSGAARPPFLTREGARSVSRRVRPSAGPRNICRQGHPARREDRRRQRQLRLLPGRPVLPAVSERVVGDRSVRRHDVGVDANIQRRRGRRTPHPVAVGREQFRKLGRGPVEHRVSAGDRVRNVRRVCVARHSRGRGTAVPIWRVCRHEPLAQI